MAKRKQYKQPPTNKHQGKRGYRLHDERIAYSGGTGSMRSIKYGLVDPTDINGLRDHIAEAIVRDNKRLYGNVNLNDYLEWRATKTDEQIANGEREPSFLGFWTKALSLGFVFANQKHDIICRFSKLKSIKCSYLDVASLINNEKITKVLTPVELAALFYIERRGLPDKDKNKLKKFFTDLLSNPYDKKEEPEKYKEWNDNADNKTAKEELGRLGDEFAKKFLELDINEKTNANFNKKLLETLGINSQIEDINIRQNAGFAIDPDFVEMRCADRTEFLDKVTQYYANKVGESQAAVLMGIGSKGNYFNSVFDAPGGGLFKFIKEKDLQKIAKDLSQQYSFNDSQCGVIEKRLKVLQEYAKKLPNKPQIITKWADYRSDFNGTIESWYSNRQGKQNIAIEQLNGKADEKTGEITGGLKELLDKISDTLPDDSGIKDGILSETIEYLENRQDKIDRAFSSELESYLATLKSDLNEYMQQFMDGKTRKYSADAPNLPNGWQKLLSKHIQLSPLFFGESKRQQWEQIYNLKSLIATETEKLKQVFGNNFTDYDITDKQIDQLAYLCNRIRSDGDKEVIARLKSIERELALNFTDQENGRSKYYLSGFERGKYKQLDIPKRIKISKLLELANLSELYAKLKSQPQDGYILRDTVQLSKIVLSATLANADKDQQRQTVLAHSNLQGYSALISKTQFIARYSVQATNGTQSQLALINDKTKKGVDAERYAYAFVGAKSGDRTTVNCIVEKGNNNQNYNIKDKLKEPNLVALKVATSRYQIQFLGWTFGKHAKKKTSLQIGGAFTIAEKTIDLDWSGSHPAVKLADDLRVFVSQPFTLIPPKKPEFDATKSANRFLGVDIGEYGLAWSLISVKGNEVKQLESGFIADNQQQVLKKEVKQWRQGQARQTFNSMNTKVALLRESLIGSYRNQLEDLAMRKHAQLCFETEVGYFESAATKRKISVIYQSVKAADVWLQKTEENLATKAMKGQSWGNVSKSSGVFGEQTTDAGTSRICTKCQKDATYWLQKTENGNLVGDYEDYSFLAKKSDKERKSIVFESLYDKVRPNLGDGQKRAFAEEKLKAAGITLDLDKFLTERGTIGLYICPNCGHISDADLQAAFNIAVRGYIKSVNPERAKKSGDSGLSREFLTKEQARLKFDPISIG